jgi:hypothetical protein
MPFLKRIKIVKYLWFSILLQYILGISLALYPHIIARLDATKAANGGSIQQEVRREDSLKEKKSTFYIFALLVTVLATVNLVEKSITLNENKENITGENFLKRYTDTLINAFQLAPEISLMSKEEIDKAQGELLRFIVKFIELYYDEKSGLKLSANLMVKKEVEDFQENDKFNKQVYFSDPTRLASTYDCLLTIVQSSSPLEHVPLEFSIPVDKDENRILFGAPRAFHSGANEVINDITSNEIDDLLIGHPKIVADSIKDFLGKMEYMSFASIPLRTSKGKSIGVVNIQSNRRYVMGSSPKDEERINSYLMPFFIILTALIK